MQEVVQKMPLSNAHITKIIRQEDEDASGVLNFEPKHLDLAIPAAAKPFVLEQQEESLESRFKIDDLVSQQTGISRAEKKKIEQKIEERVIEKLNEIQEKAYQEAYDLGLQEGKRAAYEQHDAIIKTSLQEIQQLLEGVRSMKKEALNQNEGVLIDLLYYICEKIVGEHIQKNEATIKEIMSQVIDSLDSKENITVRLNDQDFETIKKLMQEINQDSDIYKKIKFYPTQEIQKGGCIFETDHGLVDATLEERLNKLWETLNGQKPSNT